MLVVGLIEEYIFSVIALGGILFQDAITRDAMFHAQLLPELVADLLRQTVILTYFGCRTGPPAV